MCELTLDSAGLKTFEVKIWAMDAEGNRFRSKMTLIASSRLEAFMAGMQRARVCSLNPTSVVLKEIK